MGETQQTLLPALRWSTVDSFLYSLRVLTLFSLKKPL